MAYSEALANRVREALESLPNVEEKVMMGGLTFMYKGKMCLGIIKDELMCRIDPALHHEAVERRGCRTMDFTNRPMKGFVLVSEEGMHSKADYMYWVNLAITYNNQAKASKKPKKKDK